MIFQFRTPLPEPTTDSCQDCQRMFADIKDILQDKNSPVSSVFLLFEKLSPSLSVRPLHAFIQLPIFISWRGHITVHTLYI